MTNLSVKDPSVFWLLVGGAVQKKGGYVEISRAAILPLLTRGLISKEANKMLTISLGKDDGVLRDLGTYANRHIYRLEVVMKYLVSTAPQQTLVLTESDLPQELAKGDLCLHLRSGDDALMAYIAPASQGFNEGDRAIVVEPNGKTVITDKLPCPVQKLH